MVVTVLQKMTYICSILLCYVCFAEIFMKYFNRSTLIFETTNLIECMVHYFKRSVKYNIS